MPLPRRIINPAEMDAYRAACVKAELLGAIQMHRVGELPEGSVTEMPVHSAAAPFMEPKTYQPTTPEAWVASCWERGVVPVVPNR